MRGLLLIPALLVGLCGCDAVGPLTAASVGTIVVAKRDPADIVVSAVSGRDCSIVRLAIGKSYCAPVEPPPAPPPYCTRSLGVPDCWDGPNPFGYYQRPIADGPSDLNEAQERDRTARWPFKLTRDW
jgi:hypothetical protein